MFFLTKLYFSFRSEYCILIDTNEKEYQIIISNNQAHIYL